LAPPKRSRKALERLIEVAMLSALDLLVIPIDGLHIGNDLALVAPLGIDGERSQTSARPDRRSNRERRRRAGAHRQLIERGLDPKVCRLFIIDGAKAQPIQQRKTSSDDEARTDNDRDSTPLHKAVDRRQSKVIRRTFGAHTPIQRCRF
jgi:hypothetical protein